MKNKIRIIAEKFKMGRENVNRIDEDLEAELEEQFPKGDKARGRALVLFAFAQRKINKLTENEVNDKSSSDEVNDDIKDILSKNFPSAICQHCGKVTSIQFSGDFRKLIARNRTLSEINETLKEDWHRWMKAKNGEIEAMHKMIAQLIKLIPEKEREKTKEITHEMRDEIKYLEKRGKGKKN